ncbi:helix-turn-helix domain-containing protein [Ghiorsea bivora]|uniref:helix-turn-helix domain-containing protein n=1 Tax=Ghiorsea bivora TaxID=1485545 RepID=UPI00056E067E
MIKCNLSRIMGEKRIKIAELSRETGLHRNTINLLYNDTAKRIDLDALERICKHLDCRIEELFEIVD